MLTSLDHIGVCVKDLPRATRTYTTLLGRSPAWRGERVGPGTQNAIFRLANTCIELIAPAAEGGLLDGGAGGAGGQAPHEFERQLSLRGEGLAYLAFGTEDVAHAREVCVRRGLAAEAPVAKLARDVDSGAFRRTRTVALLPEETGGVSIVLIDHQSPEALMQAGPPAGADPGVAAALDHVVVMTRAPERAKALYGEKLGIRLALDRSFEQRGVRLLFFRIGGATVEVGASLAPPGDSASAPGDDRLFGLAYRVSDVDAAHARLDRAGVGVTDVRAGHKPGTRVFTIKGETHGVATLFLGDD